MLSGKSNNKNIQAINNDINRLEAQLEQSIIQFQRSSIKVTPIQVRTTLKRNETLLDFLVFKRNDFKEQKYKENHILTLIVNKIQPPPLRLIPCPDMTLVKGIGTSN